MRVQNIVALTFCLFALSGCGVSQDMEAALLDVEIQEIDVDEVMVVSEVTSADKDMTDEVFEAEELLDMFLAGEIPALYDDDDEAGIMFDQLPHDEDDWECHFAGDRIDLDNDGENEQIIYGPYGGFYVDARDGKVYVLATGEGTAGVLSYADYDNAIWIVHSDTSHVGRQTFWLTRYDGGENITDEFKLGAEYWESAEDKYGENSDFTYRDEKISMEEYEELRKEIFGY